MRIRAAVLEEFGQPLVVQDVDLAEPKAGEALVRLVSCGVCHTDLFTASGADPSGYSPCVLGHEGGRGETGAVDLRAGLVAAPVSAGAVVVHGLTVGTGLPGRGRELMGGERGGHGQTRVRLQHRLHVIVERSHERLGVDRVEPEGLTVEEQDRSIDERFLEEYTGVVDQVAHGEVVGAIHDDVVLADDVERVLGVQRHLVSDDAHIGIRGVDRLRTVGSLHVRHGLVLFFASQGRASSFARRAPWRGGIRTS